MRQNKFCSLGLWLNVYVPVIRWVNRIRNNMPVFDFRAHMCSPKWRKVQVSVLCVKFVNLTYFEQQNSYLFQY